MQSCLVLVSPCILSAPASVGLALFADITGSLAPCRGAAEGQGLGNAFLSHIQAVDGIIHVLRAFEDAEVIHVEDRIDPVDDLEIIHG